MNKVLLGCGDNCYAEDVTKNRVYYIDSQGKFKDDVGDIRDACRFDWKSYQIKVIILNGPPGCGKDVISDALIDLDNSFLKDSFKSPLLRDTANFFSIPYSELVARNNIRDLKDVKFFLYNNEMWSVREMLIHTSESIVKPQRGKDHYGRLKGYEWEHSVYNVVVSDGGFAEEISAVCEIVGKDNVSVLRLHRKGFDFSKDSRSYIEAGSVPCSVSDFWLTSGEPIEDTKKVKAIIDNLIK